MSFFNHVLFSVCLNLKSGRLKAAFIKESMWRSVGQFVRTCLCLSLSADRILSRGHLFEVKLSLRLLCSSGKENKSPFFTRIECCRVREGVISCRWHLKCLHENPLRVVQQMCFSPRPHGCSSLCECVCLDVGRCSSHSEVSGEVA